MSSTDPDPKLLHVAEAIADGRPVDWNGVAARRPDLTGDLQRLRWLERVADCYRALQRQEPGPDDSTRTLR
jgi:hypothetical protein